MPLLLRLPYELLLLIIEHSTDHRDVARIARTCKELQHLAIPALYSTYCNTESWDDNKKNDKRSFRPFLRTIVERPDLAVHCKRLEIRQFITLGDICYHGLLPPTDLSKSPCESDMNWLVNAACDQEITSCNWDYVERQILPWGEYAYWYFDYHDGIFIEHLCRGAEDAEILLILAHLPRLEKLVLHNLPSYWIYDDMFWNKPLQNVPHGFQHLRSFTSMADPANGWGLVDPATSWGLDDASSLFQFPKLATFNGEAIRQATAIQNWKCRPSSSNVTNLRLYRCVLSASVLPTLIDACATLKVFEYAPGRYDDLDTFPLTAVLMESLSRHRYSLSAFVYTLLHTEQSDRISVEAGPIESLREYEKLNYLWTDTCLLPRKMDDSFNLPSFLPKSIETFGIFGDFKQQTVSASLIVLANKAKESCPLLTVIQCAVDDGDAAHINEATKAQIEANGIKFVLGDSDDLVGTLENSPDFPI